MTDTEKKKTGGLPATNDTNPFEEYGNAATARGGIEGIILNFHKGDYLAGQEKEEVPLGTEFEALIDKLMPVGSAGRMACPSTRRTWGW